jgi:putative transposase
MAPLKPSRIWWSAEELAGAGLPDLPGTKRGINIQADRLGWKAVADCAKRKPGRGGGWLYHWSVLPQAARRKLLADAAEAPSPKQSRGEAWASFDALPEAARAKAADRLRALDLIDTLYSNGASHVQAVAEAARQAGASSRSIYNWLEMVEGVAREDRLAFLAPRHRAAKRADRKAPAAEAFLEFLKGFYLRLEQPTFSQSYRATCKKAAAEGWDTLTEKTARRRLEAGVPRVTRVFAREGERGLMRCFPAQIRDRSGLSAMEGVNADCHKIDIFVKWPDGTVNRPQIVAFQDLYSGKILSWRVDHDPNKVMVMAAFGELVETWGIPRHCLFDNGHEFANKWMTAGTPTRFRFKVREEDPLGVLPLLGIQIHWATPAHGQAKPIERAFRDLASDVAKDPRFAGAYVGNRPDAKPENYGSRAVPVDKFLEVLAEGIAEHNAREGRLSPTARGRSFDATFAKSYEAAPVRKATDEQRSLWMMGQHEGRLARDSGQFRLHGNFYHSDWMSQRAGEKVIARFNPEDLHQGLHIYDLQGAFLGFAECRQKVGFFDLSGAREEARRKRRLKKAEQELLDAHRALDADQVAEGLDQIAPSAPAALESKIVAPIFGRAKPSQGAPRVPHYDRGDDPALEAAREALVLNLPKRPEAAKPAKGFRPSADREERFAQAQEILRRSEEGLPVGEAEADWVTAYAETGEYQGLLAMHHSFGGSGRA